MKKRSAKLYFILCLLCKTIHGMAVIRAKGAGLIKSPDENCFAVV